MENTNTDARKAAIESFKQKFELPDSIEESNTVGACMHQFIDWAVEFAQSRPAALDKVSDEEIEEAADEFYNNASVWHVGYFTSFQAGVRWRESLSEQPNKKQ